MKKEVLRKEICSCNISTILTRAEAEARNHGSQRIEISHLLVALLSCDNSHAVTILEGLGKIPANIIAELKIYLKAYAGSKKSPAKLHFSYRSFHVFDFAKDEAVREGRGYIFSHHLLLGILHEVQGNAAKTLRRLEISEQNVRRKYKEISTVSPEGPHTATRADCAK
jgi:ATP-dependent Clp protease ATP-binding subunit ClpA